MKKIVLCYFLVLSFQVFSEEAPKPLREISVIVTPEGYYPKSISVFQGEKVRFFLTSTEEDANCMIVEDHKVFLAANKGKISETEVIFEKAGDFPIYCPGSKQTGKVVVISKEIKKRDVASEKDEPSKLIWMPREY